MGWSNALSWFGRKRRLAKDFENLAETLATFVTLASNQLALRRLARTKLVNSIDGGFKCTITKVGKSDWEETFARTRSNDEDVSMD